MECSQVLDVFVRPCFAVVALDDEALQAVTRSIFCYDRFTVVLTPFEYVGLLLSIVDPCTFCRRVDKAYRIHDFVE